MTVKDFIKDLQQYPDNADITLKDLNGNCLSIGSYDLIKKPDTPDEEVLEIQIIATPVSEPDDEDDDIPV